MKITEKDIKTLNKIKKICKKSECNKCVFNYDKAMCIINNQPDWWELDKVVLE